MVTPWKKNCKLIEKGDNKMTDNSDGWKALGIFSLIVSILSLIGLASTRGEVRENKKSISRLRARASDFQRTYYEKDNQRDTEYSFLWNEIKKLKSFVLTPDEKNRLLSYLNEAYREKLDVSNRL